MYFVYLLRCGDGTLYTGCTNDLRRAPGRPQRREGGPNTPAAVSPYPSSTGRSLPDKSSALRRESAIKRLSRAQKLSLIQSMGAPM